MCELRGNGKGRGSWHGDCSMLFARLGMVRSRDQRKGSRYVYDGCEFEEVRHVRVLERETGNQPLESEEDGIREWKFFVRVEDVQDGGQFLLPEIQEVGALAVGDEESGLALRKRGL